MEAITVKVRQSPPGSDVSLPRYMTDNAAGMDVFAAVSDDEVVLPGERKIIPTGIEISLPPGYEAQIRPRSGLALRCGVTILNSPGTIDADYRGEIKIIIINHGTKPFTVRRGDRIAQMVVQPVCRVCWSLSSGLDDTGRGSGGFGHTGA